MLFDDLKTQAKELPEQPGVYIMRNRLDNVIYVGKAKKLRNRVSQYFQDTASHTPKTRLMVSNIDHFEVIIAGSEFEALVLESSLIKKYKPKYNILLKDDKGYPFIRLSKNDEYPTISVVGKVADDQAEYFGPYGSRGLTMNAVKALKTILKLPTCSKKFPRDIGRDRPCLNYHMGLCTGWCTTKSNKEEYLQAISYARKILSGDFMGVCTELREQMQIAADELNFELAATLRDRLSAIENLKKKQFVTAISSVDMDAVGFSQTDAKACFSVLHFCGGSLVEKDFSLLPVQEQPAEAIAAALIQYYSETSYRPKLILLPFSIEDTELIEMYLQNEFGAKVRLRIPKRGELKRLSELAQTNAYEEVQRFTSNEERIDTALKKLSTMLSIDPPMRIESFDISNISGTDIVASMVVFVKGKPRKSEYKRFKIEGLENQDDYGSMSQVITRRFTHYVDGDAGFETAPDLLLIDGGATHAHTAQAALTALGLSFPVFGMVKDDKHRTRALVTPEGQEIGIITKQSVFSLIGNIQEQTHNFAISYHRKLRSKRLGRSQLDQIQGVGQKRKYDLIKHFKSIAAVKNATLDELEQIVPAPVAFNVYKFFHN